MTIKAKIKQYYDVEHGNTIDYEGITLKLVHEKHLDNDLSQCEQCYFNDKECGHVSCIPDERKDLAHIVYQQVQ